MATTNYRNISQNRESQFMQLSDLTDFERDQQPTDNGAGLGYEPISFDESDYPENSESFRTEDFLPEGNQNIQMAIDDYIDPNQPISISNKQITDMQNVYEMLKKQKEEERASIGMGKPPTGSGSKKRTSKSRRKSKSSANKDHLYIPRHRKKRRPYIKSTDRHIDDGGWNFDTRTTGQFDNVQKNELNREKLRKKSRKARYGISHKKTGDKDGSGASDFKNLVFKKSSANGDEVDPNALYFTDMNQVHNYLEKVDDENLKIEAQNGGLKVQDLERALEEERLKRKVNFNCC